MSSESTALEAMAREELGFDPEELGGSAWVAAIASFALFAVGAIVPVIPLRLRRRGRGGGAQPAASGLALLGIGAAITLLDRAGVWRSALRQWRSGSPRPR